jgi:hypothetical protein
MDKYPRCDIARPPPEDNPYNAWATKATVKGTAGGILSDNTLVLKVVYLLSTPFCLRLTRATRTTSASQVSHVNLGPMSFQIGYLTQMLPSSSVSLTRELP